MNLLLFFKEYLTSRDTAPSKATVKNYLADVRKFVLWFEETYHTRFDPTKITPGVIEKFKQEKLARIRRGHTSSDSGFAASSVDRYTSSLRKFFSCLKENGLIITSPFEMLNEAKNVATEDKWHLKAFKNALYLANTSDLTIKNYIIDIKQFLSWAEEVTKAKGDTYIVDKRTVLEKITPELTEEYKFRLLNNLKLSPVSINRKLSAIRKYLTWTSDEGLLANAPLVSRNLTGDTAIAGKEFLLDQKVSNTISTAASFTDEAEPEVREKSYSRFPPLRMAQKLSGLGSNLLELSLIAPLAFASDKLTYVKWAMTGKKLFSDASSQLPNAALTIGSEAIRFDPLGKILGSVPNYKKSFYAPLSMSTETMPLHKKILHHIRYTRPKWYKKYHSYTFVHYAHFALLIIFMSALGAGVYRSYTGAPKESSGVLAASVSPPRILSFQGRLTDSNDTPITAKTNLRFAIYNSQTSSGSAALWQEVDSVTPDEDGIFSVLLGNTTVIPQSLFAQNASLYIGISVGSDPEMIPRQQIATVAYATNAELLQGMPAITQPNAGTTNVVLALDSSGNLTIGGTASPTFQATGGTFTLSGNVLNLTTTPGASGNIVIAPGGSGTISMQSPIQNLSNNNTIPGISGAVQFSDNVGIYNTSQQNALSIYQTGAGNVITASQSGNTVFTVNNSGSGYFAQALGIGQQNPSSMLYVTSGGDATTATFNSTATPNTIFSFLSSSNQFASLNRNTNGDLQVNTNGSSTNIILSPTGNVGIGTSVPSSFLLQAAGNVGPNADSTYNLGSTSMRWSNLYVNNITPASTLNISGPTTFNNGLTVVSGQTLTLQGLTNAGAVLYVNNLGTVGQSTTGSIGECLTSAGTGAPSWANCTASGGTNWNVLNGTIFPKLADSLDLLIGGSSTASAKFAVLNVSSGTPVTYVGGNLGVGTTAPAAPVTISGGAGPTQFNIYPGSLDGVNSADWVTLDIPNTSNLRIWDNLSVSANVGIGNTAPGAALDVNGDILVAGGGSIDTRAAGTLTIGGTTQTGLVLGRSGQSSKIANLTTDGVVFTSGTNGMLNTEAQLAIARGGTNGSATPTAGAIAYGTGAAYAFSLAGNTGQVLTSNGAGTPTWTDAGSVGTNYWQLNAGALSPANITNDILIGSNATSSALIRLGGTANANSFFNTGGNLGIGTTAPLALVNISSTASQNLLRVDDNGDGDTSPFVVNQDGNVGVGTSAPGAKFTMPSGDISFGDSSNSQMIFEGTGGLDSVIQHFFSNFALSYNAGAKNVGGSGYTRFTANPAVQINMTTTGIAFNYVATGTAGSLFSWNTGLFVQNGGNVGIGTTTPLAVLDVNGNASVSGNLILAGGSRTIQTTANNPLTIGGTTTGDIAFSDLATFNAGATVPSGQSLTLAGITGNNQVLYGTPSTGVVAGATATSTAGQCLLSGATTPSWGSCDLGSGIWNQANGSIYPANSTVDLLLGSQATTSAKFAILNMNTGTPVASVSATGTANRPGLSLAGDGTIQSLNRGRLTIGGATTGAIQFTPNNTSTMTLVNGTVGIGTTVPTPGYSLDIAGNTIVSGTNPKLTIGDGGAEDDVLVFDGNGLDYYLGYDQTDALFKSGIGGVAGAGTITQMNLGGNFGIGTATPLAQLHVSRQLGDFAATGKALAIFDQTENQDIFTASASGTTRFVINNAGNVGIGTSIPNFPLEVVVSSQNTPIAVTNYGSGNIPSIVGRFARGTEANPTAAQTNDTLLFVGGRGYGATEFSSTSRVGVQMFASENWTDSDQGTYMQLQTTPNGSTTRATRMHIEQDGNVGIGTTTTTALLTVNGSINATFATANTERLCWDASGASNITDCTGTPGDYAEQYGASDATIEAGDVIMVDSSRPTEQVNKDGRTGHKAWIKKSIASYQPGILGVVSTDPNEVIGENFTPEENPRPVALNGRVPVKVSTENGPIKAGDSLTSSSVPGVSMKATKAGPTIGKALDSYNSSGVGKVLIFINISWSDPDVFITDAGNLSIEQTSPTTDKVKNSDNQTIERIGVFSEILVAKLQVGMIQAREISVTGAIKASQISAESITLAGMSLREYILSVVDQANNQPNVISPVDGKLAINVLSPLAQDSDISVSLENSKFEIRNSKTGGSTVAGIDNKGNATFSGTLAAQDASIAATLRAKKLEADELALSESGLSKLKDKLGTNSATIVNNITNIYQSATPSATPTASPSASPTPFDTLDTLDAQTDYAGMASMSGVLGYIPNLKSDFATFTQGLMAFGPSSLSDVSITGQLAVNGNMILSDNAINVLGADLQIQPLRQGNVSFMSGLVKIDIDGNVSVGGNATFAKNVSIKGLLATNFISPIPGEDLVIRLGGASDQSTLERDSGFVIQNASGSAVLQVNQLGDLIASGTGSFKNIAAETFKIVRGAQADTSLTETVATASAGTAIIGRNQKERTIFSPYVKEDSLIYITPNSNTGGLTPYLARQTAENKDEDTKGSFTIQLPSFTTTDIKVNWWIVN